MGVRTLRRLGGGGKIDPRTGIFPYRSREFGGYQVFPGQGSLSFWDFCKGLQPMRGVMHQDQPDGYTRGTLCRSYDINRHFSTQDRFETISRYDRLVLWLAKWYSARMMILMTFAFFFTNMWQRWK